VGEKVKLAILFSLLLISCSVSVLTYKQIQEDAEKVCESPNKERSNGRIGCHLNYIEKECVKHKEIKECKTTWPKK
jgi:hypothetical protein